MSARRARLAWIAGAGATAALLAALVLWGAALHAERNESMQRFAALSHEFLRCSTMETNSPVYRAGYSVKAYVSARTDAEKAKAFSEMREHAHWFRREEDSLPPLVWRLPGKAPERDEQGGPR